MAFYGLLAGGATVKSAFEWGKRSVQAQHPHSCCCGHSHKRDCTLFNNAVKQRTSFHSKHASNCLCQDGVGRSHPHHDANCAWLSEFLQSSISPSHPLRQPAYYDGRSLLVVGVPAGCSALSLNEAFAEQTSADLGCVDVIRLTHAVGVLVFRSAAFATKLRHWRAGVKHTAEPEQINPGLRWLLESGCVVRAPSPCCCSPELLHDESMKFVLRSQVRELCCSVKRFLFHN